MRAAVIVGVLALAGCDQSTSRAKEQVAAMLRDPSSAQFRNVKAAKGAVCGEINGKNGFGAYAGFSRFIVTPSTGAAMIEPSDVPSDDVAEAARLQCERSRHQPLYSEAERELRMLQCRQAAEMYERRADAKEFEAAYLESCPA